MKHEDKAKEIINKFREEIGLSDLNVCPTDDLDKESDELAKNCALLHVTGLILSYPTKVEHFYNSKGLNVVHVDDRRYWKAVKQQIKESK